MVSASDVAKPARLTKNQKRRLKKKEKHSENNKDQTNGVGEESVTDNQVRALCG
jgi:hypothetical protein